VTRADVLILGAGPAGAVAALNLAPTRRVILIEHRRAPIARIGEGLPPAARRLLTDMGLFDDFVGEGHLPCYGNRVVWGSTNATETDFLRDPDGHGWHLDRARFDAWLRRAAVMRGTMLLTPAQLVAMRRSGDGWQARVATIRGEVDLAVRFAIDAGGRAAPLARLLGARRLRSDRLVCGWLHGPAREIGRGAGLTIVEAVEDGWWYTTPIPGGRRVLAFLTDADLPAARIAHQRRCLNETAARAREIKAVLAESQFAPAAGGFIAAHSSVLVPCAGDRWLAVGDASMSFDPLAAQGLLHALFTGLAAAETVDGYLSGRSDAITRYQDLIHGIQFTYRRHLGLYYASEARWPASPFWQRRHSADRAALRPRREIPWSIADNHRLG
jgi:flavin-dependent dehydrogenase